MESQMDFHETTQGTFRACTASTRIAIVYHSGRGHTRRQAEAVKAGVEQVEGAEAVLLTVEEAQMRWDDLASADAIIFGTPTYVAGVSAAFKAFQEASSHAVMTKGFGWKDKIAAGFTNSGSRSGDKLATLIQIALFAAQRGMHWVNLGLPPGESFLDRIGSGSESTQLLAGRRCAVEHRPRPRPRAA
jgi:multimeric flavodoxin WrbA